MITNSVDQRRVIEALRTGVPTRAAVDALGGGQAALTNQFHALLDRVSSGQESPARGFIFNGGFGSGKSHLLESFAHTAVSEGFVVSRATISKNLPLHLQSALLFELLGSIETKQHQEDALLNMVADAFFDTRKDLSAFRAWLLSEVDSNRLAPIYSATFRAVSDLNWGSADLLTIIDYWSGASVPAPELNRIVRVYAPHISSARPKAAQRPAQTLRFLANLIVHLGFRGWIVLFDELELIRLQALLARGKAYAEISNWFGLSGDDLRGLGVVGATTPDFVRAMIDPDVHGGVHDHRHVPQRLKQNAKNEVLADDATRGMDFLMDQQPNSCRSHDRSSLHEIQNSVRAMYEGAFGCTSSQLSVQTSGAAELRSVRAYIRRWITQWDLERQGREFDVDVHGVVARPDEHDDLEQRDFGD
jgi:hypothetical protein